MFSPELIAAIKAQIALIYQAQSATQAMRIWCRRQFWEVSHKEFGKQFKSLEKDSREILEFLMEYADVETEIPGTLAVPCKAPSLTGAYTLFFEWIKKVQQGYIDVQAMANAEDQSDASDWFDHLVEDGVDLIEDLTKDLAFLSGCVSRADFELFEKKKK